MNALEQLRKFTTEGKPIVLDGDFLVFGDQRFPRSLETPYRSLKGKGPGYTLEALWFILQQEADKPYAEYLADIRKFKYAKISMVDRKDIQSYFTGELESLPFITASAEIVPPGSTSPKHSLAYTQEDDIQTREKRLKTSNQEDSLVSSSSLSSISYGEADLRDKEKEKDQAKSIAQREKAKVKPSSGDSVLSPEKVKTKKPTNKKSTPEEEEAEAKKEKLGITDTVTRNIMEREKPMRNRTTILLSNKQFMNILEVVKASIRLEERQKKVAQQKKAEEQIKTATYDRYNVKEDQFWKERLKGNEAEEFGIDTRGSFAGGALPSLMGNDGPGEKANEIKRESQSDDKMEVEGRSNNGLELAKPRVDAKAPASSVSVSSSSSSSSINKNVSSTPKAKPKSKLVPIIIVPSPMTTVISINNIGEFLETGVLNPETPEGKKKVSAQKKDHFISIYRVKKGMKVEYQVTDSPQKLSDADWNRVVAVFAHGASWQFKDWKWDSPVKVFTNVKGYYVKYDCDVIPPSIKSWDIKILAVSKSKRHLDSTAQLDFWKTIDIFISKKPSLAASLNY